jgi:hypothetical protein
MNNEEKQYRASGYYATYSGRQYFAYPLPKEVRLFTDDDPLPRGFQISSFDWSRGETFVPFGDIQRLLKLETTCVWRGHRFRVGIIVGQTANITYLGKNFDEVADLPGMQRPDKYEVIGKVPVSELTDVEEHIEEVPLDHQSKNDIEGR